jgi:hypothetical protein
MNPLPAILMMAVGVFCLLGSFKDWDFFMNNRRARIVVSLVGRKGARWFYALLGLAFLSASVAVLCD